MTQPKIKMIFAVGPNNEFGLSDNTLPWKHLPKDMKYFQEYTKDSVLIMGHNTWESLPPKKLPGRFCIVIATKPLTTPADVVVDSFARAITIATKLTMNTRTDVCVIGGKRVLEEAASIVDEVSMTQVLDTAMKTPDWTQSINYLDLEYIISTVGDRGLMDYNVKYLGADSEVNVFVITKGGI